MKGLNLYTTKKHGVGVIRTSVSLFVFLCLLGEGVYAMSPTSNQIEQFKKLSPTQQIRLAKEFGVEVPLDNVEIDSVVEVDNPELVLPRRIENVGNKDQKEHAENRIIYKIETPVERFSEVTNKQEAALKPYGYELFAGSPSTFAPVTDVPVPPSYVIGPGDVVVVQLYGKENVTRKIVVTREGVLQFPGIGPLSVVGLSYQELKQYLNNIIEKKMIGVSASITMGSLRSIRIFVLGEAHRPGSYTVSSLSTIINALFFSGGVTDLGSLRHIQLKRKGELVGELDLYDLLLKGDTSGDQRLLPGDVIFIPTSGKMVGVGGEVKRPAIYEIKEELNAGEILALAGGLLPTAYPKYSRIERINTQGERTLVDVDLTSNSGLTTTMMDSDILRVHSILDGLERVVELKGHVKREGGFALRENMRVSDVVDTYQDLLPSADLNYSVIIREGVPIREISLHSFNLNSVIESPGTDNDPLLQNRDQIIVFDGVEGDRQFILKPYLEKLSLQTRPDKPAKIVSISGNVRFPGSYPLTKEMSVAQLILASGGYQESAYKLRAEITRSKVVDGKYQEYERVEIDLSKSKMIRLQSKDQLYIKKIPNWADKTTVSIEGEVRFPGTYPIFKGDTISDLLDRAGGFTPYANPNAAIFLRESLKKREAEQLDRYKARLERDLADMKLEKTNSSKNVDDEAAVAESLLSQLVETEAIGRLVIDLLRIVNGTDKDNIELKDKDVLVIPPHSLEVSVLGEIQFPVSHLHRENKDVYDYIRNSGGYTSKSDVKRIFIVKPNGSVKSVKKFFFIKTNSQVEPGDTVVVPYDTDSVSPMVHWSNISTILFQLASVAASLKTLGAL
ncbi:MAG: hypothetical protein COB04_01325 [Gammaproteobacteria bacterium]|nr:MAG: hypothetical protein COB04_01325 [Gammaproteobacteria bacterium]